MAKFGLGRIAFLFKRRFQLFDARQKRLLLAPRLRRHFLDGVEFVSADHIHGRENSLELAPDKGFELAFDAAGGTHRTAGDTRQII